MRSLAWPRPLRPALAVPIAAGLLLALAAPAAAAPLGRPFEARAAFSSSPPQVAASASRSTVFAGMVSPALTPMVLEVDRSRVSRIATQYFTDCFVFPSVVSSRALRRARIDRKGRFSVKLVTSLVDNPRVLWRGERYPDQIVESFKGTIVKGTARGTLRATVTFLDGSTCTTGTQRWLLTHKPGRVFGGLTSQSMPVSVELSSSGTRINHLHIGWIAEGASGVWPIPDFLTNFAIVNGAVDETFRQDYPSDDGLTRYDYRLSARIGKTSSTGTLEVTVSTIDAAGTTTATWTTPTVRWTARS